MSLCLSLISGCYLRLIWAEQIFLWMKLGGVYSSPVCLGFPRCCFFESYSSVLLGDQPVWTKPDLQPQQNIEPGTSETCHCV